MAWVRRKRFRRVGDLATYAFTATALYVAWHWKAVNHAMHGLQVLDVVMYAGVIVGVFAGLGLVWRVWWSQAKKKRLYRKQDSLESLNKLTWQEFEVVIGQYFREEGFKVIETGQGGADGGMDLLIQRGRFKYLVQCKHYKKSSVGEPVVREMYGLFMHHKLDGAKIVTTGYFTKGAYSFSKGKHIELIDGDDLVESLRELNQKKG